MQAANIFNDVNDWWFYNVSLRSLHWINPARLQYVQQQICRHFQRNSAQTALYTGLRILDIGCGGGLVCEPLARLGAAVTGVDLSAAAIEAAQQHAAIQQLKIDYRCAAAETLVSDEPNYDVVLALDMLEHVAEPAAMVKTIAQLVKPGGLVILSTINRSWQAWLGAIKLAENVFKFVPKNAHNYTQLIKPNELASYCEQADLTVQNLCGIIAKPGLNGIDFILSPQRLAINYFLMATKPR